MTEESASKLGFDRSEIDVQFVLWRGPQDDVSIGQAIRRLTNI